MKKNLTVVLVASIHVLSFDAELLMPNLTETDYRKMKINKKFKAYKRNDLKVIYRINLDNENSYHGRHIITKILKMCEQNFRGKQTFTLPTFRVIQ